LFWGQQGKEFDSFKRSMIRKAHLTLARQGLECEQFIARTCDETHADFGVMPDFAWHAGGDRDHEAGGSYD
jgi:hypothetical protein